MNALTKLWMIPVIFFCALPTQAQDMKERVAVLPFKIREQAPPAIQNMRGSIFILHESFRDVTVKFDNYEVLTKDNMISMLPKGKTLRDCRGTCEVDTGRRLQVDYVVTGYLGQVDGKLDLQLRIYKTEDGSLVSTETINGRGLSDLRDQISKGDVAINMLRRLNARSGFRFVKASRDGYLFLKVSPQDANYELKINGEPVSLSGDEGLVKRKEDGWLIKLPTQVKHSLEVSAIGYLTASEPVFIRKDGIETIGVELIKEIKREKCQKGDKSCLAEVYVYTEPSDARIYVDGRPYVNDKSEPLRTEEMANSNRGGLLVSNLSLGEHIIEARVEGYLPARRSITLTEPTMYTDLFEKSPLKLESNLGNIKVVIEPAADATLYFDGKQLRGRSPFTLNDIKVGAHRMRAVAPDHKTQERVIIVSRGKDYVTHNLSLTPSYSHLKVELNEEGDRAELISGARVVLRLNQSASLRDLERATNQSGEVIYEQTPSGSHTLRITHPLYETREITSLKVPEGGDVFPYRVKLTPRYGTFGVRELGGVRGKVYIASNGQKLGSLPLDKLRLTEGRYQLLFQADERSAYDPIKGKSVVIERGKHVELKPIRFKEIKGEVFIESKPLGAKIKINGVSRGKTPKLFKLRHGRYNLEVSLDKYDTKRVPFEVKRDERTPLKVNLGENPKITVMCHPPNATVWFNGRPLGRSPQKVTDRPGGWLLSCQLGDAEAQRSITVYDGEERREHIEIPKTLINSLTARRSSMRTWGWSFVASGLAVMAGGGGMWLGPVQTSSDDRDVALQNYLAATPDQYNIRLTELAKRDEELQNWQGASMITLATGGLISAVGGMLLALSPSLK